MRRSMRALASALVVASAYASGAAAADDVRPLWNPQIPSTDARNLVPNSSFECGPCGWSSIGRPTAWGGDLCGLHGNVVQEDAVDGSSCLKIELGPGKTPVTQYDGYPAATVSQTSPLAANIGWIPVEVGETYTLSAYLRTDKPGTRARLLIRIGVDPRVGYYTQPDHAVTVELTDTWTRHSLTWVADEPQAFVAVGPDLESEDAEATVWIDAVQFEKAAQPTDYARRSPVEVGFHTDRFGNIFDTGAPATLRVAVANATAEPVELRARAAVTDYFDEARQVPEFALTVPAGDTTEASWPLELGDTGFYRAALEWEAQEHKGSTGLKFAVIEPYGHDDSPFGINHAPTTQELCRSLRAAGVVWARNCAFDWDQIEPEEGRIQYDAVERQAAHEQNAGLRILGLLPPYGSTTWASSAPEGVEKHVPDPPPWPPQWVRLGYAPAEPDKLYRFIENTVERFRDRIGHWEFYNEPFTITSLPGPEHKLPGADYTAADYVRLLEGAYKAMKAADPDCRVIGGIQSHPLEAAKEFIDAGGLAFVDAYSIHPYGLWEKTPEGFIGKMEELLALMDAHPAGRRPIWLTECGYYAADDKPWTPWFAPRGHFSATVQIRDERLASDWAVRHALIMLAHNSEKIFYHQGIEGLVNNVSWNMDNPLQAELGQPRKFYAAQSALANVLGPEPQFVAPWNPSPSDGASAPKGLYGYAFRCGDRSVLAAWAAEDEAELPWRLTVPEGSTLRNVVGAPISGSATTLGPSPVYVIDEARTPEELAAACVPVSEK